MGSKTIRKSPEQIQKENLEGAIRCASSALELLRDTPITTKNASLLSDSQGWIQAVMGQMIKDHKHIASQQAK